MQLLHFTLYSTAPYKNAEQQQKDQLRCENELRVVDIRNSEILNGKICQTIGDRTNTVGFGLQSAAKVTDII